MLDPNDRDWIQRQSLEVQKAWDRGSQWHGNKGLIMYLAAALGLLAFGGIVFSNKEIGTFGATLGLIGCMGFGGYYYFRQQQDGDDSALRRRIEDSFGAKGLKLSHDGRQVSDGAMWFDPLSSASYTKNN